MVITKMLKSFYNKVVTFAISSLTQIYCRMMRIVAKNIWKRKYFIRSGTKARNITPLEGVV